MRDSCERTYLSMIAFLCAVLLVLCPAMNSHAAIVCSGAVTPADPGTWTSSTYIEIGSLSPGEVAVDGGSSVQCDNCLVGVGIHANGKLTVTGVNTMWTSDSLTIGTSSTGILNIEAGAHVSNTYAHLNESSLATVTGADSQWISTYLYLGEFKKGTLNIDAGGQVNNTNVYVGWSTTAEGTATVTGPSSAWTASNTFYVGYSGKGILTIENGGELITTGNSLEKVVGNKAGSTGTVTVTGVGSKWINSSSVYVGKAGNGMLNIEAGGQVENAAGYLGYTAGSSGEATVSGANSKWSLSSGLFVGHKGSGKLTVSDGGLVSVNGLFASFTNLFGNGTIETTGGVLDADFLFDTAHGSQKTFGFGTGGSITYRQSEDTVLGAGYFGRGTLAIAEGVTIKSSSGYLGYGSGSNGAATVVSDGSKWNIDRSLYVGNCGNGTLSIEAGAQLSSFYGYLGAESGSTGQITVTGTGSQWTGSNTLYIGEYGSGALNVEAGGQVSNNNAYLGHEADSFGRATVNGPNSVWVNNSFLVIGSYGNGNLSIEGGAQVSNTDGYLGIAPNSQGAATITGLGSRWTNSGDLYVGNDGNGTLTVADGGTVTATTLYASRSGLVGNGTITAVGAVIDADLVFDHFQSQPQNLVRFGSGGTITLNQDANRNLGVGYKESGLLTISDGAAVDSYKGYLGYKTGAIGTAMVSGTDSKWTIGENLYAGNYGSGTLTIEAGGQVSDATAYLGYQPNSTCIATVTGIGSKWTNSSNLMVGAHSSKGTLNIEAGGEVSSSGGSIGVSPNAIGIATVTDMGSKWINSGSLSVGSLNGSGTLNIRNGGEVSSGTSVSVNNLSLLAIDVGSGSSLNVGDGSGKITNGGKVRILAGGDAVPNTVYKPILAVTWSGNGVYQAVGGTWNAATHEFTVSGVQPGNSGTPVAIDRLSTQRMLIDDGASDWRLGTSVAATGVPAPLTLTATAISGGMLDDLTGVLTAGEKLLGGWSLAASSGYTAGDPLYLSFGDGTGGSFSRKDMQVWSFDGTKWSEFDAGDLTFDGSHASFTTTNLGSYAVSVAVPEPGMMVLLACGMMALAAAVGWRRRKW